MTRYLAIESLIFYLCSLFFGNVWSQYDMDSLFKKDTSFCQFPFKYNGAVYNDCTTDGDNGDIRWCSLTTEYQGILSYCYDFRNTTLKCLPSFTMPNGVTYTKCDYLSPSQLYKQCKTDNPDVKYRYCTDALSSTGPIVLKHTTNCNPAYSILSPDHTMCYGPSIYANVVPLTSDEQRDMLALHNSYRAAVPSRYMFKLYWDDELAKLAQAHANMCVFEHDLAVNRLSPVFGWKNGQNMVMSSEIRSSPSDLFEEMFLEERDHFRYGSKCVPDNTCLHYTQLMLSNLTRVGCGQTHCVFPDRIERYVVCNYIQSQYSDTYNTPYVPSTTPAIDCPKFAKRGLCDCGSKICNYTRNEYLEPATCTCKTAQGTTVVGKRDFNDDGLNNYVGQDVRSIEKGGDKPTKPRQRTKRLDEKSDVKPIKPHRIHARSVQKKHKSGQKA